MTENCHWSERRGSIALEAGQRDEHRGLDALRLEAAELRASRERLAVAHDADRRRIERALHDGVQQDLVGIAANLELARASTDDDPAATRRILAEISGDVRRALEETRRLADLIYPPFLETGGLRTALRTAAAAAAIGIRIDIAPDTTCPSLIASVVYSCCLDVFERAETGTSVSATLRNAAGALSFELVADADLDLDASAQRDRVEALGGRLSFESGSGETRILGSLPVRE
jgi:signal transduction histidine kinase